MTAILEVTASVWRADRRSLSAKTIMKILEEEFAPSCAQTPVQGCTDHEKLSKHDTPEGTDKA